MVLTSLILITIFSTVVLTFSLTAYLNTKQPSQALFQSEEFTCGIHYYNGVPEQSGGIVIEAFHPVSLPKTLNMGDSTTLHYYEFGIYLESTSKIHLNFEATESISFQLILDSRNDTLTNWDNSPQLGQTIINETQTIHFDSELYLNGSNFYILTFNPIITRPSATVTLSFQFS
jgi:hypothetical protein